MRKSTIVIALSAMMLISSLGYIRYDQKNKNPQPAQSSYASLTPVIRQLMVVDVSNRGIFTPELISAGQLPILAIHQGNDPNDYSKDLFTFLDSIGRLTNFDRVNDDRIDPNDSIFNQLELIYLKNGKIDRIIPIGEAGIRQIYLDREHMTPEPLYPNGPRGYWHVRNMVILANGARRNVRVVPMNSSDLPTPPITYSRDQEIGDYQIFQKNQ